MKRVAVVGSGIAGLSVAWRLSHPDERCRVTLFEAEDRLGGHTHTVDVTLPDALGRPVTHGVDTGFLVFNHRTYPRLLELFAELQVHTSASDMSFSVQADGGGLEWSGCDLGTVFAQRRNLLRPRFLGMLADLMRFNRLTTRLAVQGADAELQQPIADFLDEHRFGDAFRRWYFLPMIGCIWSCPTEQMLRFPIATMIRFCHNHGLLQVTDRPQWYTVTGGAREYIRRMLPRLQDVRLSSPVTGLHRPAGGGPVTVHSRHGAEVFDEVVLACHSDQALALLGEQADADERAVLGAITYHPNRAVLHTDTALLPRRRKAWAAWNYEHAPTEALEQSGVCLHYLLDRLQPLPFAQPVIVSLNPVREPRPDQVLATFDYAHPVFDQAAIAAQPRVAELQGRRHTWFCGAWGGYGFHEDGLSSGLRVLDGLKRAWASAPERRVA
ncbi:putative NAD/FAD-binding protein [Sphaerotilus hippei]|uniref:Putative NAD/FAD-binding protein n=1 Tax=Sphaerotilus hippei TaxID=744406 RepID=A0A318H2Q7_9BURK|nr:FAD-dependent oxidoreductase [Sphaerotilus hippei]PXW95846.1 putative NAD/FAD-binding protein [Sphaerotilus hippei]